MRLIKRVIAILLFAIAVFVALLILPGPSDRNKTILIAKGSSLQVARELTNQKIIREPYSFWVGVQLFKFMGYIQAGQYLFDSYISPLQIILRMIDGDVVQYKITIPEGLYNSQVLKIIHDSPYLEGIITSKFGEGQLFPSTYHYKYGYTKEYMLVQMKTTMFMNLRSMWDRRDAGLPLKNMREALILASIVEKEAVHDDERAEIAGVFINRLKKNMRLQADPTTIYAITLGKYVLQRPLTRKDLSIKSPYNTYYAFGLPPSPICNPGIESIKAVMHPAKTKSLYFVLNEDGRHSFASNYKAHQKNVREFRKMKRN